MKKEAKLLTLGLSLIFFVIPTSSFAWGTTGHRVVAQIAQDNLTGSARREVKKLLDNQSMAYWANWCDFIKSDTTGVWNHTYPWHYIDSEKGGTMEYFINGIKNTKEENLYSETVRLISVLKNKDALKDERATALKFLIHLVGDMHQPFHTGRTEDAGGNKIKVYWFGDKTNIHSVWDSKIIDFQKYSFTEYSKVLEVMSKDKIEKFQLGTIDDWLYESHKISDRLYDDIKPDDKLSYNYNYKYNKLLDEQLQKAGLRLAKILNDVL